MKEALRRVLTGLAACFSHVRICTHGFDCMEATISFVSRLCSRDFAHSLDCGLWKPTLEAGSLGICILLKRRRHGTPSIELNSWLMGPPPKKLVSMKAANIQGSQIPRCK